jgi:SET domain
MLKTVGRRGSQQPVSPRLRPSQSVTCILAHSPRRSGFEAGCNGENQTENVLTWTFNPNVPGSRHVRPTIRTLTIYENAHLVLPAGSVIHFVNHSCDPNLWRVGTFEIATRRAVHFGEELTIDYATPSGASGFSMACSCGSPLSWCGLERRLAPPCDRDTAPATLRSRFGCSDLAD